MLKSLEEGDLMLPENKGMRRTRRGNYLGKHEDIFLI
jgi:hypothetical protein